MILSTPTRADYIFKGWKNNATGIIVSSPVRATTTISLTAQWNRLYNIIYNNLTFGSQTAFVVTTSGNVAPTQYEYGVGFDLQNVIASISSSGVYSPQFLFLGWYTDPNFTTKVTNISATQTGVVTVYAKWRYDHSYFVDSRIYTITDSGRFNQSYDTIEIKLNSTQISNLQKMGMKYLFLHIKLQLCEVNDGYQYVFVYDGVGSGATLLWESEAIRHGGDGANTNYKVYEMRILIPLDKIQNVSALYVRYGASGNYEDNWKNKEIY